MSSGSLQHGLDFTAGRPALTDSSIMARSRAGKEECETWCSMRFHMGGEAGSRPNPRARRQEGATAQTQTDRRSGKRRRASAPRDDRRHTGRRDEGYGTNALRPAVDERGAWPNIPHKANRKDRSASASKFRFVCAVAPGRSTRPAKLYAMRRRLKVGGRGLGSAHNACGCRKRDLVERFQSSNHMGCSKRPHSLDGRPTERLSGFMESIV
jgi:hypothetical protein